MIEQHKIRTSMGASDRHLEFLSTEEMKEFDYIGYSGKTLNGVPMSWVEYLNSLNKGYFSVSQTKSDRGDFVEEFMIVRSLPDDVTDARLRQLFKNNSDCYADTRDDKGNDGDVIQGMTEDVFLKVVKEIIGN